MKKLNLRSSVGRDNTRPLCGRLCAFKLLFDKSENAALNGNKALLEKETVYDEGNNAEL